MQQWGFFFNQDRCLGCKTCMLACKDWNIFRRGDANIKTFDPASPDKYEVAEGSNEKTEIYLDNNPDSAHYGDAYYQDFRKYYMKEEWRRLTTKETGYCSVDTATNTFVATVDTAHITIACNHCSKPVCRDACPVGAIYKEESIGAVLVNMDACISCGKCRQACPWDAPQYYDENFANFALNDPARPRMTKCTLCYDRVNEGLKPACVAACWNRALDAGPVEELERKYKDKGYVVSTTITGLFEDLSTEPNILFQEKQP